MIIVVIHWKIHHGEKSRRQFLQHWEKELKIKNRSCLVGEYLSEPMIESETEFPCTVFNISCSPHYQSFFNVGIWADVQSFKKEVIDPYVGATPETLPFEYEFRERMVLNPVSWRAGKYELPHTGKLE